LYDNNEKVPPAVFQARVPFFVDFNPSGFILVSEKNYDSEYVKPYFVSAANQTHSIACYDKK
jgi:hypothetical protein